MLIEGWKTAKTAPIAVNTATMLKNKEGLEDLKKKLGDLNEKMITISVKTEVKNHAD